MEPSLSSVTFLKIRRFTAAATRVKARLQRSATFRLLPGVMAVLLIGGSHLAHAGITAADRGFLAPRDAFRAGNAAQLDLIVPRLRGHLLEPYAAYYQLRLRL